ncbi:MAG TPA: phage portal protein [Usitatibacter sp.]|nr:phage portal protein [Usitatibacter sp.]
MRVFGLEIRRVKAQALSGVPSSGGWFGGLIRESFGGAWQRGITIDTQRDVLGFSGVFAPVTLIAADISKMRVKLTEEDEDGISNEVTTSPFLPVLRKPNRYQTRIQFWEQWILSKLLHGNIYALKVRDARGIVTSLYILDPQRVTPLVAETGDVYYRLTRDDLSGVGDATTVPAREIIHDRMNCLFHPLVGISPIFACGLSATQGRRIQANSTHFFANMSRPSGMLTAPDKISDELATRLKNEWDTNFSGGNLGRTAVLGEGLKYEAMTIPAEQAQLIDQLKWTVEDCARTLHVPMFKLGGPVPIGNTVEALQQTYYNDCLHVLIEAAEICLDEGLSIPSGYYTEFDTDNLLRMDGAAQITAEAEAVKGSVKAPNEARKRLNLKKLKGGDSIYMQQQNFSLEALAKRDALPNPFVIDRPTANPTPSSTGPAPAADPAANEATMLADLFVQGFDPDYIGQVDAVKSALDAIVDGQERLVASIDENTRTLHMPVKPAYFPDGKLKHAQRVENTGG